MTHCGWFPMPHNEIVAWVERHQHELPTTLAELSTYPMPFRRVIANAVDPERRLRFWTEHLQSFVGPQSELTTEQQEFVAATIPTLAKLLGAPAPNPTMSEFEARAKVVFSREQAGRIFATLGSPEPPGGLPLPADAIPSPPETPGRTGPHDR